MVLLSATRINLCVHCLRPHLWEADDVLSQWKDSARGLSSHVHKRTYVAANEAKWFFRVSLLDTPNRRSWRIGSREHSSVRLIFYLRDDHFGGFGEVRILFRFPNSKSYQCSDGLVASVVAWPQLSISYVLVRRTLYRGSRLHFSWVIVGARAINKCKYGYL